VLQYQGTTCTTHEAKAQALHSYYTEQLGSATQRECTLDWNFLQTQPHDLTMLENEVSEEEIHAAILQIPAEKAQGQMYTSVDFTRIVGTSSKLT
jgi:hypothetical protein